MVQRIDIMCVQTAHERYSARRNNELQLAELFTNNENDRAAQKENIGYVAVFYNNVGNITNGVI